MGRPGGKVAGHALDARPAAARAASDLLRAAVASLWRAGRAPARLPGRWLVFRTADPAAGLEQAVIDIELPGQDAVQGLAKMEAGAQRAVGEGHDATLVLMYLARRVRPGHDPHAAPAPTVLAITVWSLAHATTLTGRIELDEAGMPVWIGVPAALPRAASRGKH